MEIKDFFRNAKSRILIVGTNPLSPDLERSAQLFTDLLSLEDSLNIDILCESDSENFSQSLCIDADHAEVQMSFASLSVHRDRIFGRGESESEGLKGEIADKIADGLERDSLISRFNVKQLNLRLPLSIIIADSKVWVCFSGARRVSLSDYFEVTDDHVLYDSIIDMADFYVNSDRGGKYTSQRGEELIQMFDRDGVPRGIYPRSSFYTTEYERYSIWGFVFNRKGQILLHQRSQFTKDGRDLWDKSVGGHVDLTDYSTFMTAQRELVEEMFLPEAEYSKYVKADLGDIIDFGEWNPRKRPERALKSEIISIGKADWVMLRPLDDKGEPLTITRISERRIHNKNDEIKFKKTVFRSDVYLFIAPEGYVDNSEQMNRLVGLAEQAGAAQDHKLVTVEELSSWIRDEESKGLEKEVFTDDMLFVNMRYRKLLVEFSEFVKILN